MNLAQSGIKHFYISEEQSIYLLSHRDAKKHTQWLAMCREQLEAQGYSEVHEVGKGAYGFVFSGTNDEGETYVFKFSRITLPQHIQERLEEEAYMLSLIAHPQVPRHIAFNTVNKQAILMMQRAKGMDLEQFSLRRGRLSPAELVNIAAQLAALLDYLRHYQQGGQPRPLVHGDIKPSNLIWDPLSARLSLVDWGSSVFAQRDATGQFVANNIMDLMSADLHNTNARLGDVYFIGEEQLNGELSSPRFDEQGVAGTLYALASAQSCRFGAQVITPESLGLPQEFARMLSSMLSPDGDTRRRAGDYFLRHAPRMRQLYLPSHHEDESSLLPVWTQAQGREIDTVVYSSRKSFLRQGAQPGAMLDVDDAQLDKYYRNFLQGMGDTEKAFLAAVSRLGKYPVVGGLAIHWEKAGVVVDANLVLHDPALKQAFTQAVNNMVNLARAINQKGVFKSVLFDAHATLHLERAREEDAFIPPENMKIPFEVSQTQVSEDYSRVHSYFEDGKDPDEQLVLPESIVRPLIRLNRIRHTGCIVFEVLPGHLKIHSYFMLLDATQTQLVEALLAQIMAGVKDIKGLGISGFMKLPYKGNKFFSAMGQQAPRFYPKNPKQAGYSN